MKISYFRFILFKLKISGEIVALKNNYIKSTAQPQNAVYPQNFN